MMKKFLRSPILSIVVFIAAAALLVVGTIGSARAALLTPSDDYLAEIKLESIDVALAENGRTLEEGEELFTKLLAENEEFKVGKTYSEKLTVRNTGEIESYIRVTIYRYWTDADGKAVDLDPSLIVLSIPEGTGWTIDEEASTAERTVLYYEDTVAPGDETGVFVEDLTIDGSVVTAVDDLDEYIYDEVTFHVQAVADSVQTHNGEAAMVSAWGRTN